MNKSWSTPIALLLFVCVTVTFAYNHLNRPWIKHSDNHFSRSFNRVNPEGRNLQAVDMRVIRTFTRDHTRRPIITRHVDIRCPTDSSKPTRYAQYVEVVGESDIAHISCTSERTRINAPAWWPELFIDSPLAPSQLP